MSSSTPTTAAAPVKRACDSCHRRKVKCIGEGTKPCKNCISAGLNCTYNAIPQKKGPKGSRAKVLSELRETQRQSQVTFPPNDYRFEGRSISPAWPRTPGLATQELANSCMEYYFANLYPSQPILHRQRIENVIMEMDMSVESYCLVAAFCAYMLLQPNIAPPAIMSVYGENSQQLSNATYGHSLLEEAVRVRKNCNYSENPTCHTVLTSFYLYGCYFSLDQQNTAWYHLREATTHAHSLGMQDEETYKTLDAIDSSRRRRLFWLLFITERAYALHKHRPLTLHATINLPTLEEDPTERIPLTGFIHLINLYKPFDDTFIGLWNKVRTNCLPSWLLQLQTQLSDALPNYLDSTEVQAVDLRTSQLWLKTMVWQLSISHNFISSMAPDNAMSFKYPIEISRDWISMSSQFSQQAMEVHGVGLIEKLFDVACTLTDVLSYVPLSYDTPFDPSFSQSSPPSPRDYLHRFLDLISTLRSGQPRYTTMLLEKINDMLPNMAAQLDLNSGLGGGGSTAGYPTSSPSSTSAASGLPSSHQGQHGPGAGDNPPVFNEASAAASIANTANLSSGAGVPLRPGPGPGRSHNVSVNISLSQYPDPPSIYMKMTQHGSHQPTPQQQGQQRSEYTQQQQRGDFSHLSHHPHHHSQHHQHISPHNPTAPPQYGFPPPGSQTLGSSAIPAMSMSGYPDPSISSVGVGVTVGVGPGVSSSTTAGQGGMYGVPGGHAPGAQGRGGGYGD